MLKSIVLRIHGIRDQEGDAIMGVRDIPSINIRGRADERFYVRMAVAHKKSAASSFNFRH